MTANKLTANDTVDSRQRPQTFAALTSQIEAFLITRTHRPLRRFVQPTALTLWREARRRFGMPPASAAGEGSE